MRIVRKASQRGRDDQQPNRCTVANREDSIDFMADDPVHGEQRWCTSAIAAEQLFFSWRRMLPGTGGRSNGHRHAGRETAGPRTVAKAGIFAESAARVVAGDIAASLADGETSDSCRGWGVCYADFGGGLVSKVEVDFLRGAAAEAQRNDPSSEYAAEKEEFGATGRARWFGL